MADVTVTVSGSDDFLVASLIAFIELGLAEQEDVRIIRAQRSATDVDRLYPEELAPMDVEIIEDIY